MIVNLQRGVKLELAPIRAFAATLSEIVPEAAGRTFSVAFVSDRRMTGLNRHFRGKDAATDVLSFRSSADEFEPEPQGLGDIVISARQAQKQAAENGLSLEIELKQLILHGLLHLCGYDHATDNGEMDYRELELRRTLDI